MKIRPCSHKYQISQIRAHMIPFHLFRKTLCIYLKIHPKTNISLTIWVLGALGGP